MPTCFIGYIVAPFFAFVNTFFKFSAIFFCLPVMLNIYNTLVKKLTFIKKGNYFFIDKNTEKIYNTYNTDRFYKPM